MHRLISDPSDESKTKIPTLPLLVVFPDGMIIENDSTEDIVTVMTDINYSKLNEEDKCLKRIKLARIHAMYALQYNITAIVILNGSLIKNNYAVAQDDKDYIYTDEELKNAEKIIVDDDKSLLISLVKFGNIKILEKVGSTIFLEKSDEESKDNAYREIPTK
ncbi:MAG: hypothetical protein ABF289_00710 [Clostridiales bacterium]